MKIILRNIKSLIKSHIFFFFLIILCVVSSSSIMLFAFGVYHNYQEKTKEYEATDTYLVFDFLQWNEEHTELAMFGNVTLGELREALGKLKKNTIESAPLIAVFYYTPDARTRMPLGSRFYVKNGNHYPLAELEDNMFAGGQVISGRSYTLQEYTEGAKVLQATEDMLEEDGTVLIGGEAFTPIMIVNTVPDVPFPSVSDSVVVDDITFDFGRAPRPEYASDLIKTMAEQFGDRVILPEFDEVSQENYYLYKTMIFIAILIAAVAAVNIVILYHYILIKRRKSLAVFMLCGCTRHKAVGVYLGEVLVLTVPLFILSALAYHYAILPQFEQLLPYAAEAYSLPLYALALGIYTVLCTAGMWLLAHTVVYRHSIAAVQAGNYRM